MKSGKRLFLLITASLWLAVPAVAFQETLNDKIVKFCKDHQKKTVGDGECFALAAAAVETAGGKLPSEFSKAPNKNGPIWGDLVYSLAIDGRQKEEKKVSGKKILPGHVIQMGDAKFERSGFSMSFPVHTAVVIGIKDAGRVLIVNEQNFGGKRFVTQNTYRLNDLKAGWVRIYQPVAK